MIKIEWHGLGRFGIPADLDGIPVMQKLDFTEVAAFFLSTLFSLSTNNKSVISILFRACFPFSTEALPPSDPF